MAPYWRIRSGIKQGDAALCAEVNLALALQAYSGVQSVDFETIWGKGHTEAGDSGDATDNFINWVKDCSASGGSTSGITPAAVATRLEIYPNPASTTVTVKAGGIVNVFDNAGRLALQTTARDGQASVDATSFPAGVYQVRCGKAVAQFIVE